MGVIKRVIRVNKKIRKALITEVSNAWKDNPQKSKFSQ